jgi:cytochrome c553
MNKALVPVALVLALGSGIAQAAPAKAAMCVACHGAEGMSPNPMWPNLAGQHAVYLESAMKAYKTGLRKDPLMSGIAMGLSDKDIKELAEYYENM